MHFQSGNIPFIFVTTLQYTLIPTTREECDKYDSGTYNNNVAITWRIVTKLSFFSDVESGKHFEVIVVCISLLSTIVFISVAVLSVKRFVSCNTFIDICQLIITNLHLL